MSKSYSKIRHMQEANLMLESRMMNKRMLLEDNKEGDIEASPREPEQIASGMRDAVFQVYDYKGQKGQQYFYTCVSNRDLPLDKQTWDQKAGAISDGNGKSVTASQLKLLPGWEGKLNVACKSQYDNLAKWRQTFCANLKNKTKPNYAWNCPDSEKPVAAAAVTSGMPAVTSEGEGPIQNAESYGDLPFSSTDPFNGKISYLISSDYIMWRWKSETEREVRFFTTGNPFTLGVGKANAPYIDSPRGTDITDLVLLWTK